MLPGPLPADPLFKAKLMTNVKLFLAALLAAGLAARGTARQPAPGVANEERQSASAPASAANPSLAQKEGRRIEQAPAVREVAQLRNGDVPIGSLGRALGDYLTVEGKRAEGGKISAQTLLIDTVNGKKLKEPTAIEVDNVRELPKGIRIVLKGYETGKMHGPVPAAIQAAEEAGEVVLLPQRGWQWVACFIALSAVEPKLEIREETTGFKTARQKKIEEEKDK
jgi:hypothetical protein